MEKVSFSPFVVFPREKSPPLASAAIDAFCGRKFFKPEIIAAQRGPEVETELTEFETGREVLWEAQTGGGYQASNSAIYILGAIYLVGALAAAIIVAIFIDTTSRCFFVLCLVLVIVICTR